MSLVKTKRQANFKDFDPLRGSSNKKKNVFNSFVCKYIIVHIICTIAGIKSGTSNFYQI
jgi:hypothetical protein